MLLLLLLRLGTKAALARCRVAVARSDISGEGNTLAAATGRLCAVGATITGFSTTDDEAEKFLFGFGGWWGLGAGFQGAV